MMDIKKEQNFFEGRVTEYQKGLGRRPLGRLLAHAKSLEEGGRLRLSEGDLYLLIEKALVENEAYDVAKSLAFRRSMEKSRQHRRPQRP
jgi:hypothetical protein